MSNELLPCPFCGGEAEILTAESMHGGYLFGIMCNDCRSRGDIFDTEAEAIKAWNTRKPMQNIEAYVRMAIQEAERTCKAYMQSGFLKDEPNAVEFSCGHFCLWPDEVPPKYCPDCGAKVVE